MAYLFDQYNTPLSGRELIALFYHADYQNEVVKSGRVPHGATMSLEKIEAWYGTKPSPYGHGISNIVKIRNYLFNIVGGEAYYYKVRPFVIVAPHSHWDKIKPTIYIAPNPTSYIIGQHDIKPGSFYYPVTFIFSQNGPIPFEWAEQSVPLDAKEHIEVLETIISLNDKLQTTDFPLGIAMDFRFKKSLYDNATASLELPITEDGHSYNGFSSIVPRKEFERNNQKIEVEQVSWHAISDLFEGFNEIEIEILNHYRNALGQLKTAVEKEAYIKGIESTLNG